MSALFQRSQLNIIITLLLNDGFEKGRNVFLTFSISVCHILCWEKVIQMNE